MTPDPGSHAGPGQPAQAGWRRMARLLSPRPGRSQAVVAVLCALLGFGFAVQVRSADAGSVLRTARQDDLVQILDDLNNKADRLRTEVDDLQATKQQLSAGANRSQAALAEARRRSEELGILAGTLPATGPGVVLTVRDPLKKVTGDVLLDAVEELRDAGAEAMQVAAVRIVASTYFVDDRGGGVDVDGKHLTPPYVFTVIGDPKTLSAALAIPGGVLDTVDARPGATATVESSPHVSVSALRPPSTPRYARPAPGQGGG
jgi:uncharacterized protein YlxW (UPF0749 family)